MDPVTLALAKSWAEGQFGDLRQLQQHIAALQTVSGLAPITDDLQTVSGLAPITDDLQTVSGLAPYVQALLDSRIVEMGSNSNGEYVRWENGLQVCWHQLSFAFTSGGTNNLLVTWVFPAAFDNINYRMIGVPVTALPQTYIFAHGGGRTATSVIARIERPSDTGNITVPAEVLAIGRWK